ncbi:metal-sensitive transcriptional regulator [Microvirga roseola]|uniref:metal-sensitive transcriptional regulator n=1 Tax=Microvirga roseola TaxID=2883126 RepID=UPI001E33D6BE|nr:metal-sensitive transcriptional regulator [Microvirga roseola]
MAGSKEKHGGKDVDHMQQLPRLRRIEGQVRGVQQMIQDGRYCGDVTNQINAVIAALRRVQADMLSDHLKACIEASLSGDLSEGERQRLVDEIARLIAGLGRRP